MARRKRVPKLLWKQYRRKARTLSETVMSLVPPSTSTTDCRHCNNRRCIACCGLDYLLTPDDSPDYRKLLNKCFVVVSENAPPLLHYRPDSCWTQSEIVWRTIEKIMPEKQRSPNALCYGYDKWNHSSMIIKLLTSAAWIHLSRRAGDAVMVYLLMHTSIFLPLPRNKYHQVAGFPMSKSILMLPKHGPETEDMYHSHLSLGSPRKGNRIEINLRSGKTKFDGSSTADFCSSCFGCVGHRCSTSYGGHCKEFHIQMNSHGDELEITGAAHANKEGILVGAYPESSALSEVHSRKRSRPPRWERCRKRRLLSSQEARNLSPMVKSLSEKDNLSRDQMETFTKNLQACSCCSVFLTMQKNSIAQIDRRSMFYNMENESTVFPSKHILNGLKPNVHDANLLFRNIFGLSDVNIISQSVPCFHSNNTCLTASKCLYHSILKLLKVLIRKAKFCQHIRLLEKHCGIQSFDEANELAGFISRGDPSHINSLIEVKGGGELVVNSITGDSVCLDAHTSEKTSRGTATQTDSSTSYCPKRKVVSFIWAVCRSVIPADLLGTSKAQRTLRRNISKFIRLRRYEKFSLKQSMHKLKASNFPVLSNKHALCYFTNILKKQSEGKNLDLGNGCIIVDDATHVVKHTILESWILWLFSSLIVPLVCINFYVTEIEHGKQDIFYYQKSTWEKIMSNGIACLNDQSFELLNYESVKKIICSRSFGFSRVRFLPKSTGVRPLANLKASSRIQISSPLQTVYRKFSSVNGSLRELHAVLKGIRLEEPEKLGSSVFDYGDVYRKLYSFLSVLRSQSGTIPDLFIVVADIAKAFDSINQDKLLSVMKDIKINDIYLLEKFDRVVCPKNSLQVYEHFIVGHQNISSMPTKCKSTVSDRSSNCVIVNKEWRRKLTKEEVFSTLIDHVKSNVLLLDRKFYLQNVGIAQGSILSSLLCSLYYGHMENSTLFPFLAKLCESDKGYITKGSNCSNASRCEVASSVSPRYMLLRFIDDFLFISTSEKQALGFFTRLQRGFREYNCQMNQEKFGLNFDIRHIPNFQSHRFYVGGDGASFLCWNGLFINCCTLEVQADYTRYLSSHLSSSLAVCCQGNPGKLKEKLKEKLHDYLRPKSDPIFCDHNINSPAVVRLNIFQAFLICAMKFHCHMAELSVICRLEPKSCIEIICSSLRFMSNLINSRLSSMHRDFGLGPVVKVMKSEVQWLGLTAYKRVLKRKESRHKNLLALLNLKLLKFNSAEIDSSALTYAVDDLHSSLIWKIKY